MAGMSNARGDRATSMARAGEVMREFQARSVLFQDAVAKWGGVNSTDLQCVGLLMSDGPATPENWPSAQGSPQAARSPRSSTASSQWASCAATGMQLTGGA